jgi:hypothetical protein
LVSIENMRLLPARAAVGQFGGGQLGLRLELRVGETFPPEASRLWRLPFAIRVWLGSIDTEDVFDAAPGELGERDFAGFAQSLGASEDVVGELDLSSCHADSLTAQRDAVNVAARVQLDASECSSYCVSDPSRCPFRPGGLPRVVELIEARKPRETAVISEIDGLGQAWWDCEGSE